MSQEFFPSAPPPTNIANAGGIEKFPGLLTMLGRFTSTLVHDLRSPLTVIRNSVHFLRGMVPPSTKMTDHLDMIDSETTEMNRVFTRLLEVCQEWTPDPEDVEFEPMVTELIAELDRNREVYWRCDFRYQPTVIWCDRARFKQAIRQLLSNAISAMKGEGEIFITAWQEPEGHLIEVRDRGPGVPPEIKETLFDPFVTTKRTSMGLGLTYCQTVVKRHLGTITVDSTSSGATFRILLPRKGPRSVLGKPAVVT
jgi:signal transduction histidine kinase